MLFPAYKWIKFLRNYGPIPTNGNLFDEHVNTALRHARVLPITLPTPYVDEMVEHLQSECSCSLLIAGTAGDGKTYHCRQLWARMGGAAEVWESADTIKHLILPDGRLIVFVKDLSELNAQDGDQVLTGLERSVLGGDYQTIYIVASNHGQILDRLRKRKGYDGIPSALHQVIQDAFLQSSFEHERLRIFDLSRSAHRQSLVEVLSAVTDHVEWVKCVNCELNIGGRVCPISENRKRVMGQDDGGRFSRRLGDLIEIARLNGAHLPIRDLLALVVSTATEK